MQQRAGLLMGRPDCERGRIQGVLGRVLQCARVCEPLNVHTAMCVS
jgi:hypothetical protein